MKGQTARRVRSPRRERPRMGVQCGGEKQYPRDQTGTHQKLFPFPETLRSIIALILLSTETRIHLSVHSSV